MFPPLDDLFPPLDDLFDMAPLVVRRPLEPSRIIRLDVRDVRSLVIADLPSASLVNALACAACAVCAACAASFLRT